MKIQSITNKPCMTNHTNFDGNVILTEKLSESGERFIKQSMEKLSKLVETKPYDIYVKEVQKEEKESPILVLTIKGKKKLDVQKLAILSYISEKIEDVKPTKEEILELKMPEVNIKEIVEQMPFLVKNKPKREFYVPKTIGKPRKPYIKRH